MGDKKGQKRDKLTSQGRGETEGEGRGPGGNWVLAGAGKDACLFQGQRRCSRGEVDVECHHQLGLEVLINSGTTWLAGAFLKVCP